MTSSFFKKIILSFLLLPYASALQAQHFSPDEYKKALWMTTRMYGGQRSGEQNWLVYDHLPSGVNASLRGKCFTGDQDTDGYDLSGGWHDAGDHVKFGHTQYYSAYMLLKGYAEFPTGYDDFYNYDYQGYKNAGNWNWEGNGHVPNGIPDVLEEIKHATDYFIKCTKNSNTFYYQVGQGTPDHAQWVTAVKMQTLALSQGGQTRVVYKNPADASMPSFCGAALALMSRVYKKFDPSYAALCLQHAVYAYDYAKAHPGVGGTGDGGFYTANANWKDDYATLCAELFWATNNNSYKTEALSFSVGQSSGDIYGNSYGFDYSNNGDIALYNLARLGNNSAATALSGIVNNYYLANVQADGQFNGGNTSWGPLRYNVNTAFIVALWQKLQGTDATPHVYLYDNLDYILGDNTAGQSFVVGFGTKSPKFPHHRNIFLRDDNPSDVVKATLLIPVKNAQAGLMVGGTRTPASFTDDLANFQHTESGIDYNACLVGVLAYITSDLAPVDTSKFGHPIPDLGATKTLCGVSSLLLDARIEADGKKKFEWLKDGNQMAAPSFTNTSYTVTAAGRYTCIVDSAGKWSTRSSVDILGALPNVNLGGNKDLCNPASYTLDLGVAGTGITYEWKKDNVVLSGATARTLTVYTPGLYRGILHASGCASKYDEAIMTSQLPLATHPTICAPGAVDLSVSGTGGPYKWFPSETGGTAIFTGPHYSTTVSSSQIFYVEDQSSLNTTAGPHATSHTLVTPDNLGRIGILFTAAKAFTISEITVVPYVYYCGPTTKLSISFSLKQGSTVLGTYAATQVACVGEQSTVFNDYYTFSFPTPVAVPAAGSYELVPTSGEQLVFYHSGANLNSMDIPGLIDITDDTKPDKPTSFPGIFDLKIQAGSGCARTPVVVTIDPLAPSCGVSSATEAATVLVENIQIVPNPSLDVFTLESPEEVTVKIFDVSGKKRKEWERVKTIVFGEDLPVGMYHVLLYRNGFFVKSMNLLKH